jgi:hypothetical protein
MGKTKRRKYRHLFRFGGFGGKQTVSIAVACSDASHRVRLPRAEADVLAGKPGISVACANAQCAMDGKGNFPHPVYLAEFVRSYAYIVDRLDRHGQPTHCVKYRHDDGNWIGKFDKPGGKAKLIASGDAERVVNLSPPQKHRYRPGRPRGTIDGSRSKTLPHGAHKRAIDAGWVIAPQKS